MKLRMPCLALDPETRLQIVFPLQTAVPGGASRKRRHREHERQARKPPPDAGLTDASEGRLFELRKRGFNRLYQTGQVFEFSTPESLLDIDFDQPVFMLVDRLGSFGRSRAPASWMRWRPLSGNAAK